jgi:hypothetical protein
LFTEEVLRERIEEYRYLRTQRSARQGRAGQVGRQAGRQAGQGQDSKIRTTLRALPACLTGSWRED